MKSIDIYWSQLGKTKEAFYNDEEVQNALDFLDKKASEYYDKHVADTLRTESNIEEHINMLVYEGDVRDVDPFDLIWLESH